MKYVLAFGEDAREWSRHRGIDRAIEEAERLQLRLRHGTDITVWLDRDFDGSGGTGPVWSTRAKGL
jgi:hypothetical protein